MLFNLNDFNCCLILWHLVPITPQESISTELLCRVRVTRAIQIVAFRMSAHCT